MKKYIYYWLAVGLIVFLGCQKETSFETPNVPAEGSLQADVSGDCLPKTVNGSYIAGTALVPANNSIVLEINVTKTGTYDFGTDTVNGYFFHGTGNFTTLGPTNVTLRGNGTPIADGTNNFVVSFDSTFCDIQVTVLPVGTGPATFTLVSGGTPTNCASAVVNGTYVKNAALTATNNVDVTVNVTVVGTYTIKATGGGMTFQKTSAFSTLGNQTVRLDGSGTPTTAGANTVTFDPPFNSCNFTVTVTNPVSGSLGGAPGACTPVTVNGTYTNGVALTASNTVSIQITTSAVGPYSISTNTVAGISFSASGTSNGATQTITLAGTGTPTASGSQAFTVTFGSSTCTFNVNINAAASPAWVPDCATAVVDGLYETNLQLNCSNTITLDVNVTTPGPWSITTTAVNGMTFSGSGTFASAGTASITLTGSGTPTAAGTFNVSIPGTTACTVPVVVDVPFGPIDWKFTRTTAPTVIFAGQVDDAQIIPNGSAVVIAIVGSNSAGSDDFQIGISDFNGTVTVGETYSSSANPATTNSAAFQYTTPTPSNCDDTYKADFTVTGVTLTITVTAINTTTQTISGTFSGTAKNIANATITIASGTFTATYHP
jgi:hypothetical protein